jgi:hypothetical protein
MTKAQTTWDTMTPRQRLAAVNIDIMDHIDFSILSGLVTMGEIHVVPDLPTAGTNGVDVFYGEAFVMTLNRKQLRFVQLHETMHKSLRHCSEYTDICEKYPELSNVAMDYVVNAFIEQTDPEHKFMEFPDAPEPLLDPKYYDRAFVDILQDLLRNPPPPPPRRGKPEDGQGGDGQDEQHGHGGIPKPLDEHIPTPKGLDKDELSKRVRDALTHGEMVQKRIAKNAGKASAGNPLSGLGRKRDTDWRNALREWVQEICAGDEYSRYNPPNRRMLPLASSFCLRTSTLRWTSFISIATHQAQCMASIQLCSVRSLTSAVKPTPRQFVSCGGTAQCAVSKCSSAVSTTSLQTSLHLPVGVAHLHNVSLTMFNQSNTNRLVPSG